MAFLRYVKARESERVDAAMYRRYVADSLFYSATNQRLTVRYAELLERLKTPNDERSGDEIAADVIGRLKLKPRKGGPSE